MSSMWKGWAKKQVDCVFPSILSFVTIKEPLNYKMQAGLVDELIKNVVESWEKIHEKPKHRGTKMSQKLVQSWKNGIKL